MVDRLGGSLLVTAFILSVLIVTIVAWWIVARRRQRAARSRLRDLPLFAVPVASGPIPRPTLAASDARWRTPPSSDYAPFAPSHPPVEQRAPYATGAPTGPTVRTRDGEVSTLARPARAPSFPTNSESPGEPVDGASVRYWRAADGTLQFLPGRLEVAAGRDTGHEIRFVRTAGPDGTSVTFGRAEGAAYRHVQLREPTVSRIHARMCLEPTGSVGAPPHGDSDGNGSRWRLENMSATNPVIVNGRALAESGRHSSVILSDGDRIEMGEVNFVFRAR